MEELQKSLVEEREGKEKMLEDLTSAKEKSKDFRVKSSLFEHEEKYIKEELERINKQNKLMEDD